MKKIIFSIVIIAIIAVSAFFYFNNKKSASEIQCDTKNGLSWCGDLRRCITEDEICGPLDEKTKLLSAVGGVFGMELGLIPRVFDWENNGKKVYLDGKGYYYTDILDSEKIKSVWAGLNNYFSQNGFSKETSDGKSPVVYKKDNIVCNLDKITNPNKTSSISASCAYDDGVICDTATDCGTECDNDEQCGAKLDACSKKTVCKNMGFKFFYNCLNPTNDASKIDFTIQSCKCEDRKCVWNNPQPKN